MLGRSSWKGPVDSEPGWAGSSLVWIRRLWRLGPVSVSEAVFLRSRNGERGVLWRRLCFLDEDRQKRLAGRPVLRYMTVFWFWMYLLVSRWDRERDIEPAAARKRWGFLEEQVPEWSRDRKLRDLGL